MIVHQKQSTNHHVRQTNFVNGQTPTLFLHGYGGSANSETFMVKQAEDRSVTRNVITAFVSKEGNVTLKGHFNQDAVNPIVKLELEDNKQGNLEENAKWFKSVLVKLQGEYKIKQFNFVGHSMGNLTFAQYMRTYGEDASLPQLYKQVNIAGTFNGVLNMNETVNEISVDSNGKPSRMNPPYNQLRVLKDIYKGKDIAVLNIFGDLEDGTHSDGRVSNSSSQSLKYLLGNSPKHYKESKYQGKSAQHSQLHENKEVANELIDFLWKKN
ncbi:alpha/beta hydrolase [Staphylococcus edaphicus]|uniref:alpha/beta hydrolase n=1 Tax=Staphylococcus edaphicus TaxID=1955013 RepID=UPI003B75C2EF